MRFVLRMFCALIIAAEAGAQTLSLPHIDAVNAFYRAGKISGLHAEPTSPCSHGWSANPACGWGFETVYEMIDTKPGDSPPVVQPELAVGYDFLNVQGKLANKFDVIGSIQTLPSITFYLNFNELSFRHRAGAYVGLGTGFATLKNFKAYLNDKPISVSGDTWALTPSVGGSWTFTEADLKKPGFYVFGEVSYELRKFAGIDYKLPADIKDFPTDLPRSISAGGRVINLGFGFTFHKEPKK
jgi:hypothetical protein